MASTHGGFLGSPVVMLKVFSRTGVCIHIYALNTLVPVIGLRMLRRFVASDSNAIITLSTCQKQKKNGERVNRLRPQRQRGHFPCLRSFLPSQLDTKKKRVGNQPLEEVAKCPGKY